MATTPNPLRGVTSSFILLGNTDNPEYNEYITTSIRNNQTNVTELAAAASDKTDAFLKRLFDIILIVAVCVVMISLGCTITLKVLKAHLKRPFGIMIGLLCQFIVFPAVTFGLAHALQLEKWNAIGMILLGTSPGGSISNILTYYCEGEVTLSVSMTAISTVVGIGMMPLNSWIYSRSWADHKTVIPIKSIMIGLASMLIPVAIGMVILVKLPKLAKCITRIGSGFGFLMIGGVIAFGVYLYPHIFTSGWQMCMASCLLPILGLTIGYASASVCCLPHASRRAIAIETGCQNVALCLTLVTIAYGVDVYLKVLVFPTLFGVLGSATHLAVVGLYHIQKILRRRLQVGPNGNKMMSPDETELNIRKKKDIGNDIEADNVDSDGTNQVML